MTRSVLALTITLVLSSQLLAAGKKYAMLVGVEKYDNKLPACEYAENDFRALEKVLTKADYKVHVSLNADRKQFDEFIDKSLTPCDKDDLLIVAFCGHGVSFKNNKRPYLGLKDADLRDPKTLLAFEDLQTKIGKRKITNVVYLLDASRIPSTDAYRGLESIDFEKSVSVLLANPLTKMPASPEDKRGVFFQKVSDGLVGAAVNGDDDITFQSLAKYLDIEVKSPGVVLTRHPEAIPVDEWKEYYRVWLHLGTGTKPFLEKNAPKRFEAWKKSAEAGSPRGMMLLADCYEFSIGVAKPDIRACAKWYKLASERGNTFAMVGLALCYESGKGVFPNKDEAIKWARKAAELGDATAMSHLATCYYLGRGVKKDETESHRWWIKSAENGSTEAMNLLSDLYLEQTTVVRNYDHALRYLEKSVELGNIRAMERLGFMYLLGHGVKRDPKLAQPYFAKAAESGSPGAMLMVGRMYLYGEDVPKDEKLGLSWVKKSAEADLKYAMTEYGDCLFLGIGTKKDEVEAFEWYKKAADKMHAQAMKRLADCYISGRGVKKDIKESIRWLQKAADLGDEEAQEILKKLDK